MLAEMLASTSETLQVPPEDIHCWCDSNIALSWLRGCPSSYRTFVANRVASAARNVQPSVWLHVPTDQNPADCTSRGLSAQELRNHHLWWGGPPWLLQEPVPIPPQPNAAELARVRGEEAKPMAVYATSVKAVSWWEPKFNDYMSLLHATAYVFKFCSRILKAVTRGQPAVKGDQLTVAAISAAETFLYKQSQARSFGEELGKLSAAKPVPIMKSSRLRMVHPILSDKGLLLVGGRLNKANLTPLQKHPVILSASDQLTKLIFKHYHVLLSHCGPTLLLAHTAALIYVVGAKQLARAVCKDCLVCKQRAPRAQAQLMGQLPAPRVNRAPCFIHTGVDYAGPIQLKRGNPRRPSITKGYLALFVCLATKAVHIEVVSSLSTEALNAALQRFSSSKGLPQHMYSDYGTNFVGAKHELRDLYNFLSLTTTEVAVKECLLRRSITWHLILEMAPHFGGIWEAVVKAAKHHLRRTVGTVKLYYEEMATVTAACLNSRPYLAQDGHDAEGEMSLTPGHFLIGRPTQAYPEAPVEPDLTLRNRWKLCQALVQSFWDSWSNSYLRSLQSSRKWHKPFPNVKIGDLVMVLEENPLLTHWKMGRITATFPGDDNLVRTAEVTVKTTVFPDYYRKTTRKLDPKDLKVKTSTFRRPEIKLAPLMSVAPAEPHR